MCQKMWLPICSTVSFVIRHLPTVCQNITIWLPMHLYWYDTWLNTYIFLSYEADYEIQLIKFCPKIVIRQYVKTPTRASIEIAYTKRVFNYVIKLNTAYQLQVLSSVDEQTCWCNRSYSGKLPSFFSLTSYARNCEIPRCHCNLLKMDQYHTRPSSLGVIFTWSMSAVHFNSDCTGNQSEWFHRVSWESVSLFFVSFCVD